MVYLAEFSKPAPLGYNSPDGRWQVTVKRENSDYQIGGFYSLSIQEMNSGSIRMLFTFWDADVEAGYRLDVKWSSDGKALQLKGDTRGFLYSDGGNMKYSPFHFIYLVDADKMYSMPV